MRLLKVFTHKDKVYSQWMDLSDDSHVFAEDDFDQKNDLMHTDSSGYCYVNNTRLGRWMKNGFGWFFVFDNPDLFNFESNTDDLIRAERMLFMYLNK